MQVQREKYRAEEENPAPTKSKRFECPFDDCDASFKTRFYFCSNAAFSSNVPLPPIFKIALKNYFTSIPSNYGLETQNPRSLVI